MQTFRQGAQGILLAGLTTREKCYGICACLAVCTRTNPDALCYEHEGVSASET